MRIEVIFALGKSDIFFGQGFQQIVFHTKYSFNPNQGLTNAQ
jgi:hypothetical protein